MTITNIIQPISLLRGTHGDTGSTGQGCFMNVIAYLNGDPQITDKSDCVCYVVQPIAIWLNDFADDEQRRQLIPFIERAMGSRTDDRAEISRRLALVVDFANLCSKYAAEAARYAAAEAARYAADAWYAAAEAARYAAEAARYAAADAARYADAAWYAAADAARYAARYAANRKALFAAGMAFIDAALPRMTWESAAHLERALWLAKIGALQSKD